MIGYDIDGTLVDEQGPIRCPSGDYVIISARPHTEYQETVKQLGSCRAIYLRPPHLTGEEWKPQIINLLGVTKYYEDNELHASAIEKNCPLCEVVRV